MNNRSGKESAAGLICRAPWRKAVPSRTSIVASGPFAAASLKSTGLYLFIALSALLHGGLYHLLAGGGAVPKDPVVETITLVDFAPPPIIVASPRPPTPPVPMTKPQRKPAVVPPPVAEKASAGAESAPFAPEVPSPAVATESATTRTTERNLAAASAQRAPALHPTEPSRVGGDGTAPDTRLARYIRRIQQQVQDHLHYPQRARKRRLEGQGVFRFVIAADGSVAPEEIGVKQSCGSALLDRAAITTISWAAPFPPPPSPPLEVIAPIAFELH